MVCRVPEMMEVDGPDKYTDDGDNLGEHVAKIIQFALQGCLLGDLRGNGFVYISNRRLLPSVDYDGICSSIDNRCPLYQT